MNFDDQIGKCVPVGAGVVEQSGGEACLALVPPIPSFDRQNLLGNKLVQRYSPIRNYL